MDSRVQCQTLPFSISESTGPPSLVLLRLYVLFGTTVCRRATFRCGFCRSPDSPAFLHFARCAAEMALLLSPLPRRGGAQRTQNAVQWVACMHALSRHCHRTRAEKIKIRALLVSWNNPDNVLVNGPHYLLYRRNLKVK